MPDFGRPLLATLLVSLRLVPMIAFSPPFTLVRIPALVRVILCLALSAWLVAGHPQQTALVQGEARLAGTAFAELLLGIALALVLQLAFAALMTAGRAVDLQAGYAFAMIADPSSRAQVPLIGMIFAYAAAAIFFASNGSAQLLAIFSLSLEQAPLGAALSPNAPAVLAAFFGTALVMAVGGAGLVLLVLFMIDASIALMSRTLPQMNVLFLGFQVKSIATLLLLPIALGGSAALYLRMFRFAFDTLLKLA